MGSNESCVMTKYRVSLYLLWISSLTQHSKGSKDEIQNHLMWRMNEPSSSSSPTIFEKTEKLSTIARGRILIKVYFYRSSALAICFAFSLEKLWQYCLFSDFSQQFPRAEIKSVIVWVVGKFHSKLSPSQPLKKNTNWLPPYECMKIFHDQKVSFAKLKAF